MKFYQLPEPQYTNDLIFAVDPATSVEYQKAMSMGAFLAWPHDMPVNVLFKNHSLHDESILENYWAVVDTDSALEVLEWLLNEGHRAHWDDALALCLESKPTEDEGAIEFARNFENSITMIVHHKLITSKSEVYNLKIDAWDYGRVVFVASSSFYLGYLSHDQAMSIILRAYEQMKQVYRTWTDYGRSYMIGRLAWGGPRENTYDFLMVMITMLRYEESTWNRFPLDPFYLEQYNQEKKKLLNQRFTRFNG